MRSGLLLALSGLLVLSCNKGKDEEVEPESDGPRVLETRLNQKNRTLVPVEISSSRVQYGGRQATRGHEFEFATALGGRHRTQREGDGEGCECVAHDSGHPTAGSDRVLCS